MDTSFFNDVLHYAVKAEVPWPAAAEASYRDLEHSSEEDLIWLIQHGTRSQKNEAISTIYYRYNVELYRFILSRVGSEDGAKDVFSEVWIIALKKLPTFKCQGIPIKAWLFRIARFKCQEMFGSESQQDRIYREALYLQVIQILEIDLCLRDESPPPPLTSDRAPELQAIAARLLQAAIDQLSGDERNIILLVYYREYQTSQEIGQELAMRPATVRQKHKRALRKLRTYLDSDQAFAP